MSSFQIKVVAYLCVICFAHLTAEATELHVRSQAQPKSTLVVLGDVAEIYDADPQAAARLAAIELFPAPAQTRSLRIRELQDLLVFRGVDLRECRFGGSNVVRISPAPLASPAIAQVSYDRPLADVNQRVSQAIIAYLNVGVEQAEWTVQVNLTPEQEAAFNNPAATLTAGGGRGPWTGEQQFTVMARTNRAAQRVVVTALVSRPATMAVAFVRPVQRGETIRADHVTLTEWQPTNLPNREPISNVDEVIGQEATRPITAGDFADQRSLRAPRMVMRNQNVLVTCFSAGVRVRTYGRALDDGAQGDIINVQTLDRKETYSARVSGYEQVEVFAQAPSVAPPELFTPPSPTARSTSPATRR